MTLSVHLKMVELVSRQLAPIIKSIIGTWLLACFDPAKEVQQKAQESFRVFFKLIQECFSPKIKGLCLLPIRNH
jgi:hypothetical protein